MENIKGQNLDYVVFHNVFSYIQMHFEHSFVFIIHESLYLNFQRLNIKLGVKKYQRTTNNTKNVWEQRLGKEGDHTSQN